MEPYAEFTKLENWDNEGKPYLAEVSILRYYPCTREADIPLVQGLRQAEGQDCYRHWW